MAFRKNMFQLLKYNIKTLVAFEVIYKTITLLLFIFISVNGFNLTLQHTGDYYLSIQNLNSVIQSNEAFLYFLVLFVFIILTEIYHTTALILLFDSSYQREKMKLKNLFLITNVKCLQLLNLKNILFCILFLFILIYCKFNHAEYLLYIINIFQKYKFIFYIIFFVLISFLLKRKYIFHFILLEDMRFNKSKKNSIKLTKYHFTEDLFSLFLTFLFIIILFYIMYILTYHYLNIPKVLDNLSITIIWCIILIAITIFLSLSKILYYLTIGTLFYKQKIEKGDLVDINTYEDITSHKIYKLFVGVLFLIVIFITIKSADYTYQIMEGNVNFQTEHINRVEVTAHRGASLDYPENTMSAFKGAKKLGAEWIELDVQQTKDGKIIVFHDGEFTRVSGVDTRPLEVPYHVIKRYDAGRYFDKKFDGEKIPLLEDVILFAKNNNMKLIIELKTYNKNEDFEKKVLDIIKTYEYEKKCIIASGSYESLEKVKNISSEIKTYYISYEVDDEFINSSNIDGFCVENSVIDETLVNKIHNLDKKIWTWTVDSEETLNHMIYLKVDNIITNDITLTNRILKEKKVNDRKKESEITKKIFQ